MKFKRKSSSKTEFEFEIEMIDYIFFYTVVKDLTAFINGLFYKKKLKFESL